MADGGSMYSVFNMDFARQMTRLCAKADIIVPNFTEAAFMLGEEYRPAPYTKEFVESTLKGSPSSAVKGGSDGRCIRQKQVGSATYDRLTGKISYALSDTVDGYFHGTGDVFASALLGAYLNGLTLAESARIAVDYTHGCIERTKEAGTDLRYGVDFEHGIPDLLRQTGII